MPFEITIKPSPSVHSSNKHNILCQEDDPKPLHGPLNGKAPLPSIDRLTVTLTVPPGQAGKDMFKGYWAIAADETVLKTAPASKGYKRGHKICLPSIHDTKKWPYFSVNWLDQTMTKFRLDFVPADLGHDGLVELSAVLTGLMEDGWGYVVKHARITRIDVALDFSGVKMDEFHFLPTQGASSASWSQSGMLETFQHGKSSGNCTMIYDRGVKRKSQGKSWQQIAGVRVERRLRNPNIRLDELQSLANPFSGMSLVERVIGPPPTETKQRYIWDLFLVTAEAIGAPIALAKLPSKKRTAYRKHLAKHVQPWWDPKAFWTRWAPMLAVLKIADATAWY